LGSRSNGNVAGGHGGHGGHGSAGHGGSARGGMPRQNAGRPPQGGMSSRPAHRQGPPGRKHSK
jgi:hypothetical protein